MKDYTVGSSQRARLLLRDRGICQLCRTAKKPLGIRYLVVPADWASLSALLPDGEQLLRSDENLAVLCEGCNLKLGDETVSPVTVAALFITQRDITDRGETR